MSSFDLRGLRAIASNLPSQCRKRLFEEAPHVDLVITTDPAHIGYLTGYRSILQDIMVFAQAAVVSRERALLVTGASDAAAALEHLQDPAVIWRYGQFFVSSSEGVAGYGDMPPAQPTYPEALNAALTSLPLAGLRVGLDVRDVQIAESVVKRFTDAVFEDAGEALKRARAVKLPHELTLLRHAARITDDAIRSVHPMIRSGVTELEIAAEISREMVRYGGISRFVVVTSGERSSRVDAYASAKELKRGDLVRLDIGCSVDGYCSDMARTFVVGEPTPLQRSRYEALLAGQQAEIAALKPGIRASEVFDVAVGTVRSGALPTYQRSHCGHGIGLRSHEYPPLSPQSDAVLEAGMVFCLETPYYELGWGGMMVEDTAIITSSGHELLTVSSRELHLGG